MKQVSLDDLSVQQWTEALHSSFEVLAESGASVAIELIDVKAQSPPGARFEAFSLLFRGPVDQPLTQRTYPFRHEQFGAFDLFIVPVAADASGRQYEAVFNRISPAR